MFFMKPVKYSDSDASDTDLGTKIIHKYPTPTKDYDIARMEVRGRFPKNGYIFNNVCDFFIYVLVGTGTVYAGDETFQVEPKDVVFVPAKNKYAVDGAFEYITVDVPEWNADQAEEVTE